MRQEGEHFVRTIIRCARLPCRLVREIRRRLFTLNLVQVYSRVPMLCYKREKFGCSIFNDRFGLWPLVEAA